MLYSLSRFLARLLLKLFFKIEAEGKEVFPANTPFILASNHFSNFDPPALSVCCPRQIGFLAKEELFKNKLFGACLRALGVIPLNREKAGLRTIRLCLERLKFGGLLVFPQGTRGRSLDNALSGVGFLCKKAEVPVVAARIYGTDKVFPKGAKFPRRGRIKVVFSKVDDIEAGDSYREVTLKVVNKIKSL